MDRFASYDGTAQDWARPVVHWEIVARDPERQRASLDRAVALGATLVTEPFDVPGGPTLAAVDDPEGNPLVLVQQ
jgi:Glyoxalase-like domain